ncbi:MAG: hypothetical protein AAF367_12045 [Pseudomonadota bacterium]
MIDESDVGSPGNTRVDVIRRLVKDLRSANEERGVDMTPDQIVDATVAKFIDEKRVGAKGKNDDV